MNKDIENKIKKVSCNLSTLLTLTKVISVGINDPNNLDCTDLANLVYELEDKIKETVNTQQSVIDDLNI